MLQAHSKTGAMTIGQEADDLEEVGQGLLFVFRDIVSSETTNASLIKLSVLAMVKIKEVLPTMSKQVSEVLKELVGCQLSAIKQIMEGDAD